jgi:hypothetical protein
MMRRRYYEPLKLIHESKYGDKNNFFRFKVEDKKVYWKFMKDEY